MARCLVFVGAMMLLVAALGCERGLERRAELHTSADVASQIRKGFSGQGTTGKGEVAAADPTGFATLRGMFKVSGAAPRMARLTATGDDASLCAPGGQGPLSEEVVVGPGGELANVVVYLDTKIPSEWEHEGYAETKDALLSGAQGFDQKACVFTSHVFAMRSSQIVEIINSDPVGHNTNIQPVNGAQRSNNSLPANSVSVYEPGGQSAAPFPVTCSIHPWMKAHMITRDSPYFAVSQKDGSFEIKNAPTGVPLTFRVWQERAGFLQEVTVNGSAEKWSRGRYETTLNAGEDVNLDVVINASVFE